jgi:signal transduction histidine kinase
MNQRSTEQRSADSDAKRGEHAHLESRTRRNWSLLVSTSVLSTLGLGIAVLPLLSSDIAELWPWAYTNHTLLAGLSLSVTALAWYLTQQERRVTALRIQLLETRRRELRHCRSYGRAVASANAALHREIRQREHIQEELRSLNETLEQRVAERSAAAEKHAEEAQQAKISLESQNQRLRELYQTARQFVDTVSHEFRTPLTVIREYASALSEGLAGKTTKTQREYLLTVMNRVDDMSTMVSDMLDISRIEADLLRTCRRRCAVSDITDSVCGTLGRKATKAQVKIEFDMNSDNLPPVFCDIEKIGRVLINLGVNAIKFSRPEDVVRVWARLREDGSEVVIGVTDRGPGIARENLEKIFDRFQQLDGSARASAKGFGLGLNIVRELVLLNFGSLNVESELGQGSTFSFSLPLADPERLIPVYLSRVPSVRARDGYVTLLEASSDTEIAPDVLEKLQRLIEDNTRRTDLIYRSEAGSWLIAAASREPGMHQLTERMYEALREANSGDDAPWPHVNWRVDGCWRIDTEGDEFRRRFLALCRRDAPASAAEPAPRPRHESRT